MYATTNNRMITDMFLGSLSQNDSILKKDIYLLVDESTQASLDNATMLAKTIEFQLCMNMMYKQNFS